VKRKIFRNTLFLSGSQIVGRLIGFFYFIYLARSLSVTDFGIYAWVLGFVYNFYPLADFGIEKIVIRDLPRKPEKANYYLKRLLPLRLYLGLASLLILLIVGLLMGIGSFKLFLVFLFGLSILPTNLIHLIAFIENAREKSMTYALSTLGIISLTALLGVLIINFNLPLAYLLIAYFISSLTVLGFLFSKMHSLGLNLGWKQDFLFWKKIIKDAWAFALITTLAVFYLRISLVLTGYLLGDYWAGIYGASSKFIEAGVMIPQGITLALFPLFSRLLKGDKKRLKAIYLKTWFLLLMLSLPIGATMFWGGKFFIPLIYGSEYLPSVPVFSTMGLLIIFLFVNSIAGNIIHNSKKVKQFLPFSFLNFLVGLGLGLFLIPRIGVMGGVWAMVGGEVFGLIVNNLFVFKILNE